MSIRIYLGGNISPDPQTYQWREAFVDLVRQYDEIEVINPCATTYDVALREHFAGDEATKLDGSAYTEAELQRNSKLLPRMDFRLLMSCDVNVVNLELNTPGHTMIGTMWEMAWCHDLFQIPNIGIVGPEGFENEYTRHPFVKWGLELDVPDVEAAASAIINTYLT
jgi:hypothetical protein